LTAAEAWAAFGRSLAFSEAVMVRRHEISDEGWALVVGLMPPPPARGGGRWRSHRQVFNGLLWKLGTGAQWRDLPERYGPWQTVYSRFVRWRRDGTFDRLLDRLRLRLDEEGRLDPGTWCIDGTSVRASRSAAGGGRARRASPRTTASAARAAATARSSTC
jgi:transposase